MVIDGLILTILTAFLLIAITVCNKWMRKVTNCYFFWLAIASLCLGWLLANRFIPDWITYTSHSSDVGDFEISKAFMLDACPFVAFSICVSLIVDPTRKMARLFSPLAIIGGAITIASLCFDDSIGTQLTAKFIFYGIEPNKCYFIMHFIQLFLGVFVLLNTPRGDWKNWLATLLVTASYYFYVLIIMNVTGCKYNCSGVSIFDWIDGEYAMAREIIGWPPIICQCVGLPLMFCVGSGIVALKDYVFSSGHFSYGNAYSGTWYFWYNYNKFEKIRIL